MATKGQYIYEYPHPAVTADCVVFGYDGKELKVLLIRRGAEKDPDEMEVDNGDDLEAYITAMRRKKK